MRKNKTQLAKGLRKNSTEAESKLWRTLRDKRLNGLRFRRQQPIGDYIVDFVCFENRLILEIDGGYHIKASKSDTIRDEWLRSQGFRVLRFWNDDIMQNLNGVVQEVDRFAGSPSPLSPPVKGGGNKEQARITRIR